MMPGKGEVKLTGQMGDVMKESATIALSYVRSVGEKYHIKPDLFSENDFHIHIPEGAVPKDGPSAGITMATAILSTVIGKKVFCKVAKTAGIRKVLVPQENEKDVEELDKEITDGMDIIFVSNMDEVVYQAIDTDN